jgi:hypothetical protein
MTNGLTSFNNVAAKINDAGYHVTGSPDDLFRVYTGGNANPIVKDGVLTVPKAWKTWADNAKKQYKDDYFASDMQWSEAWSDGMSEKGDTFAYFGPSWFIDYTLAPSTLSSMKGKAGDWAITTAPVPYSWGGTLLSVAQGSDNAHLAYDIITGFTLDASVQKTLATENSSLTVSKSVMKELAGSSNKNIVLGNQNPYVIYEKASKNLSINQDALGYGETLTTVYAAAMSFYIGGYITYDEALDAFYEVAEGYYPELKIKKTK